MTMGLSHSGSQLAVITLLALLPVPLLYVLYNRYFKVSHQPALRLQNLAFGGILACLFLLAAPFLSSYLNGGTFFALAFLQAAMPEKLGVFLFLLLLTGKRGDETPVLNGIMTGMLLGLGFAAVENIFYALSSSASIIFIRSISSVPLHVFSCGIMGYFLGDSRLYKSFVPRMVRAVTAFLVPFLIHGLYDYFFFRGGKLPYLNALLLVAAGIALEYFLARSQNKPSIDALELSGLRYEEWRSIQRDPQYERWIRHSMGAKDVATERLLRFRLNPLRYTAVFILAVTGTFSGLFHQTIMDFLNITLTPQEAVMLFVLLPLFYAVTMLMQNIINPRYFQNSILRIPVITDLIYYLEGSKEDQMTYDITLSTCFLKTIEPITKGKTLKLLFDCAGMTSPEVEGIVVWNYHNLEDNQNGTMVRFTGRESGYYYFYFQYIFYKFFKGIYFNLKLPGAGNIRRLFVRPESILQREYHYEKGAVIFRQGEQGRDFYLIRKGEIGIYKIGEDGEEIFFNTLHEGDILGEMAIAGDQPRMAEARCNTECILARGEADNLDVLIRESPEFARSLINIFAKRLYSSEKK